MAVLDHALNPRAGAVDDDFASIRRQHRLVAVRESDERLCAVLPEHFDPRSDRQQRAIWRVVIREYVDPGSTLVTQKRLGIDAVNVLTVDIP